MEAGYRDAKRVLATRRRQEEHAAAIAAERARVEERRPRRSVAGGSGAPGASPKVVTLHSPETKAE
jgi:hypothetical protein